MIRYEINSNVASSEAGLQDFLEIQDMADTFAYNDIEVRLVKQLVREEDEINIASQQFAQGIRVKGKTVREARPESSLRGCLSWLRSTVGRVDRGLHIRLESRTATNGVALVLGQLFARGQSAYISNSEDGNWELLTTIPDPSLSAIPDSLKNQSGVKESILSRQTRPTGFSSMLQQVVTLKFLPGAKCDAYREIVRTRNFDAIKALPAEEVINLVLIYEITERYRGLLEGFCKLLNQTEQSADIATQFELLCQGISIKDLQRQLTGFVLENKRAGITGKRGLINEVRICLNNSESMLREQFQTVFTSLVIEQRMRVDPELYRRAVLLLPTRPEEQEVLNMVREEMAVLGPEMERFESTGPEGDAQAPEVIRRKLFEIVVRLNYASRYTVEFGSGVPPGPTFARGLLSCFSFKVFNVGKLRSLNPKLPYTGIAKNLSDKIPVSWAEVMAIQELLTEIVYPMGEVVGKITSTIREQIQDQAKQKKVGELNAYLQGSYKLVASSNYILGQTAMTELMRLGLIDSGDAMGLTVLTSRDQIRRRDGRSDELDGADVGIEGHIPLMSNEDQKLFPMTAHPMTLRRAYEFLVTQQVASTVRLFVNNKLNYLVERFRGRLFEIIYQNLVWSHQFYLSRAQLVQILVAGNVFDAQRLKILGFDPEANDVATRENTFLSLDKSSDVQSTPLDLRALEQRYIAAVKGMNAIRDDYKRHAHDNELYGLLLEANDQGVLNLHDDHLKLALAASKAADSLWQAVENLVKKNYKTVLAGAKQEEAVKITLPGRLAYLALLRRDGTVALGEHSFLFRLQPDWDMRMDELNEGSRLIASDLELLLKSPAGKPLKSFQDILARHDVAWRELRHAGGPVLTNLILRESILTLIKPQSPSVKELSGLAENSVMCLSTSSMDQGKFSHIVAHPERREVYATISELASWLTRFTRLRAELEDFRAVITDIRAIIASFNFSLFDAPYIDVLSKDLERLNELLKVRPEDVNGDDLEDIESQAVHVSRALQNIHQRELKLSFQDRWLSRIVIRLRGIRPNTRLNFADALFERSVEEVEPEENAEDSEPTRPRESRKRAKDYQTFSERVRNVIEARKLLESKAVYVLSPANTQKRLTLSVIEHLFRLRGLFLPIFVDISGCPGFVDELRAQLPPHRIFDLGDM